MNSHPSSKGQKSSKERKCRRDILRPYYKKRHFKFLDLLSDAASRMLVKWLINFINILNWRTLNKIWAAMYGLMDPNAFRDILIFQSVVFYSRIHFCIFETILKYVNSCS